VLADVDAPHQRLAVVGAAEALEDLNRRRLAGPVGTEQSEDLSLLDAEGDAIDRHEAPVPLTQPLNDDRKAIRLRSETRIAGPRDHTHAAANYRCCLRRTSDLRSRRASPSSSPLRRPPRPVGSRAGG